MWKQTNENSQRGYQMVPWHFFNVWREEQSTYLNHDEGKSNIECEVPTVHMQFLQDVSA